MTNGTRVAINTRRTVVTPSRQRCGGGIAKKATAPKASAKPRFTTVAIGEGASEVRLRFPAGKRPSTITVTRGKLFFGVPKSAKKSIKLVAEVVKYSTLDGVKGFFSQLLQRATPEQLTIAAIAANPTPAPKQEQWFRIELSETALSAGASEEYPDGWCGKLVEPQPRGYWNEMTPHELGFSRDCVYVQLPFHYRVEYEDEDGKRLKVSYKTDIVGRKDSYRDHLEYEAVECGMWVPRSILKNISVEDAAKIFEEIKATNF